MRSLSVALLVLVSTLGLAGCLDGGAEDAPIEAAATPDVQIGDRPEPTFGNVSVGTLAAPDEAATLAAAPKLREGEWWRIRFEDPFTGETVDFVRVVAKVNDDGSYVLGMPHEGWYKEAVVFHAPGFGDINADLSYNTHDILFTPVKFPLTNDQTWTTSFSGGADATAHVQADEATQTATITFTTPDSGILGTPAAADGKPNVVLEIVYDAKIHEVSEFRHPTAIYQVVEHGYDFEGWITVPRGEKLIFFHGRIGPAIDINLQPAPPTDTIEISGGYNRVTFILAAQAFAPGGAYRETAIAPDGTTFESEWIPHPGGFLTDFYEYANPDGEWSVTHLVAGGGAGFIEGIAYHQYDIHLPDGAIRSDHSHEVIR